MYWDEPCYIISPDFDFAAQGDTDSSVGRVWRGNKWVPPPDDFTWDSERYGARLRVNVALLLALLRTPPALLHLF